MENQSITHNAVSHFNTIALGRYLSSVHIAKYLGQPKQLLNKKLQT